MTRRPVVLPPRAMAAQVVSEVLHTGRSLTVALEHALATPAETPLAHAALIQEMAYGTLRWAIALQALLLAFLKKPLKQKDQDIHALLLVGLYQLTHMQVAPHAAVTETVSAASALGKVWAKDLVNAVLRNFLRMPPAERADLLRAPHLAHSHPAWLLQHLRAAWPDDWPAICSANNARPPMTLRVNRLKTTRADYLVALTGRGMPATTVAYTDDGLTLAQPVPVAALPGFHTGQVSVQDGAAQLAAMLLDAQPGEQILDACAAPGGKTCHILERTPSVRLVAVDHDAQRMERVRQNLTRLELSATLIIGDAATPNDWWQGPVFDRILLDAPCSATGVIRRHPDIKHHRTEQDLVELQGTQARILDALWPWLAPGGKLLYVTCSILPMENEHQMRDFLLRHRDAAAVPLALPWAHATGHGYQILPGESGMDGFYYACARKTFGAEGS
jgi:16S rRNA (cytosine967-C5)-methyltransferase